MKFKAIGFDFGGVIEGQPGTAFNAMVCETIGISEEEYILAYFAHNKDTVNGRLISEEELWKRVLSDLAKPNMHEILIDAIRDYKKKKNSINQPLLEFIKALRQNNFKTGLLSNNSVEVANRLRDEGIDKYFDSFLVSAEVNMSKPDPKFFEYFIDDLGVQMNELVFVDDSTQSLSTAEECGFTPILYKSYSDFLQQLKIHGIDIS